MPRPRLRAGFLACGGIGLAWLCFGCSDASPGGDDPVVRGQALFESGALSDSSLNLYSCSTCHDAGSGDPSRRFPGAALAGVTLRPTFWGGQENDLLRSIDACRAYFMFASAPLVAGSAEGRALYAFLESLGPGDSQPVAFSVRTAIEELPRGDADSGAALFAQACATCHGSLHEGSGVLSRRIPVLPDDTLSDHVGYTPAEQRLVFIEKVRHGGFLGYGGSMAPFSSEVLADQELSDILEALAVLGE